MSLARCLACVPCLLLLVPAPLPAQGKDDDLLFQSGNIKVKNRMQFRDKDAPLAFTQLLRDNIDFGHCFRDEEHRRMPVTYYHPKGPLGMVMQKFNWFPGPANTYLADARMPASLVGLGASSLDASLEQLVGLWSEPPVAIIGLEAGTPVSYIRPLQRVDIYEPTKELIDLHERKGPDRLFHFIPDARRRGAAVSIIHGSPRQQLQKRGPRGFYHLMVFEACSGENGEKLFLDLFTREGIAQCMEHLTEEGILCVHTSHRFIDLPPVLSAIAGDLKLSVQRGRDNAPGAFDRKLGDEEMGHFTSEWVMIARKMKYLDAACKVPPGYPFEDYWVTPRPSKNVWTDKGPNLLHGVLRGHPATMRYSAAMGPVADFLADSAKKAGLGLDGQRFFREWDRLPRSVENWMVQSQLRTNPEVAKLWP